MILVVQRSRIKRDDEHAHTSLCFCPVTTGMLTLEVDCVIKASKHAARPIAVVSIVIIVTIVFDSSNSINNIASCIEHQLVLNNVSSLGRSF